MSDASKREFFTKALQNKSHVPNKDQADRQNTLYTSDCNSATGGANTSAYWTSVLHIKVNEFWSSHGLRAYNTAFRFRLRLWSAKSNYIWRITDGITRSNTKKSLERDFKSRKQTKWFPWTLLNPSLWNGRHQLCSSLRMTQPPLLPWLSKAERTVDKGLVAYTSQVTWTILTTFLAALRLFSPRYKLQIMES